jgi:HSP20 family protein
MIGNLLPWKKREEALERRREEAPDLFSDSFDDLFGELFTSPFGGLGVARRMAPSLDVSENKNHVMVSAELPGLDPEDVELTLDDDVLTIRGEKRVENTEEDERYTRRERRYGSFTRRVVLPCAVQSDKVKASFKNGVLKVKLAKDPDAQPKRIAVTG